MADKYGPIFEEVVKKNWEAFDKGNADIAIATYDDNGVLVDKKSGKIHAGPAQIKEMFAEIAKLGKFEFKMPQYVIHDVGGDRFYVDFNFESKFESGLVLKGASQQLYHKKGDQWKCVYESVEMQ